MSVSRTNSSCLQFHNYVWKWNSRTWRNVRWFKKNDEDVTCNYRKNNGKPKGQIIVLIIANYGNRTRLDCHSTKFHLLWQRLTKKKTRSLLYETPLIMTKINKERDWVIAVWNTTHYGKIKLERKNSEYISLQDSSSYFQNRLHIHYWQWVGA